MQPAAHVARVGCQRIVVAVCLVHTQAHTLHTSSIHRAKHTAAVLLLLLAGSVFIAALAMSVAAVHILAWTLPAAAAVTSIDVSA